MLILGHDDVRALLGGAEREILDLVRETYRRHEEGRTTVPFSTFLRFPDSERNRIIGLPAYVGGAEPTAGMKWISSFPGNLALGLERASAAILVNSMRTGRPEALVEGSVISAKRTAASAALAADLLTSAAPPRGVTLFGCGVINREILRFLRVALPSLTSATLYDTDPDRAAEFARRCPEVAPGVGVSVAREAAEALAAQPLVSLATTAVHPHLDLAECGPGSTVLHVSLRDVYPEAVLRTTNVVDDVDHVLRERTSLHLAEQLTGGRDFVSATIGQLIVGSAPVPRQPDRPVVFSPFGLGALDIALADHVLRAARRLGAGVSVPGFLPGDVPAVAVTGPVA